MPQTLTQSFSQLHVDDQQTRCTTSNEDPCALVKYHPLPTNWRDIDSYLFYGWAINDAMCERYLQRYPDARRLAASGDPLCPVLWHLEKRVGYFHGRAVTAKVDGLSPPDRIICSEYGDHYFVLSLSCTKNKSLFRRRPTVKQMKVLAEEFGEEPRWFTGSSTKEEFWQLGYW
ncbi:hypothetical protein HGRIS_013968 [Hohenbuehelia grisea]|uniref:Uncharacterized protein n=1 Tax=Hohenbuehelia grisea TaxID=104357 RepID=A0ABR3JU22_9AGAR